MDCEAVQAALSAIADDEHTASDVPRASVDAHVRGCADCRAFAATAAEVRTQLRLGVVDDPLDVTDRVLAAVEVEDEAEDEDDRAASADPTPPPTPAPDGAATAVARLGRSAGPADRRRVVVRVAAIGLSAAAVLAVAFVIGRRSAPQPLEAADTGERVTATATATDPGAADGHDPHGGPTSERSTTSSGPPTSTSPSSPTSTPDPPADADADADDDPTSTPGPLLGVVWNSGRLDQELSDAVATIDDIESTVVNRATAELTAARGDGWVLPIDTIAVEPVRYGELSGSASIAAIGPGQGALGERAAERRGAGVGDTLRFGAATVEVTAIVPEAAIGGAELVVDRPTGAALGVDVPRYRLIRFEGWPGPLGERLESLIDRPVRFRAEGQIPELRSNDRILTLGELKDELGEFAYRRTGAGIEVDGEWRAANIRTAVVEGIGEVTCHRKVFPQFIEGLEVAQRLAAERGEPVELETFAGCYNPRTIAGSAELSRHSWGGAVDFGGIDAVPDEVLTEALIEVGFSWGGDWLSPDGGHFEYTG